MSPQNHQYTQVLLNAYIGGAIKIRAFTLALFLLPAFLFVTTFVLAEDATIESGPLDGMVFAGKIGPIEHPDTDDELHFSNGKFWSKTCTRCGFQPGHYWVRKEGDITHFRGELVSERGTFVYFGKIKDGKVEAKIKWAIKRWYWTINRDFAFNGSLTAGKTALTANKASQIASNARDNLPSTCQ